MNKLILITIILIALLFGVLQFTSKQNVVHKETRTRYYYAPGIVTKLSHVNSTLRMSQKDLDGLDAYMFALVKSKKLPPTEASRFYAYVLTAQKEAADLSYFVKGEYMGSLQPVTYEMICVLYPDYCQKVSNDPVKDAYSLELSRLVTEQYKLRIVHDSQSTHAPEVLEGDEYWKGKPVTPDAGSWMLWNIKDTSAYIAPTPPVHGSEEDAKEIENVKNAVLNITPEQKKAVMYWAGGAGTETPAGIWLGIMNTYIKTKPALTFDQVLAIRSGLSTTMADAFIVCWHNKFIYWTMRPNMRDTSIVTVIKTPPFPSYVSGHSTVSAAAATMLSHYFPENKTKWMQMAEEAKNSRLWSGIHFPSDNDAGFSLGTKLATDTTSLL